MAVNGREAMYYEQLEQGELICRLCPHNCHLQVGQRGICRGRTNLRGRLIATNYAQTVALALDKIEKKPLYHYYPGSQILSLGPNSCNLACDFCQNYRISQMDAPTEELSPQALRDVILQHSPQDMQVAFTYSEALSWYEYIRDFAAIYPSIRIVLVTNAFLNPKPFRELMPYISALNIDLKAIDDSFYQKYCRAYLPPVLENIQIAAKADKHIEITLLLIEGLNDKADDIQALAKYIAMINPDIPLHISAYHPAYKMQIAATRQSAIETAIELAQKHLHYVYGGNLRTTDFMQTACPNCGTQLIKRSFEGSQSRVKADKRCPECGQQIYGHYI